MSDAAFLERVQKVFRETFDQDDLVIYDAMQAKDVVGWDSLNHVTLIVGLEKEFGVRFTTREVMAFQNVGETVACLRSKLATKG